MHMTIGNTSVLIREGQLAQLRLIAEANSSNIGLEIVRAYERYLLWQFSTYETEIKLWQATVFAQRQALFKWLASEQHNATSRSPRPEVSALKPKTARNLVGCELTLIRITREQMNQFEILGEFYGQTFGALMENAYGEYIQAEMLDDSEAFAARLKTATEQRVIVVERLLQLDLHISP
jgi:hypothetical protein